MKKGILYQRYSSNRIILAPESLYTNKERRHSHSINEHLMRTQLDDSGMYHIQALALPHFLKPGEQFDFLCLGEQSAAGKPPMSRWNDPQPSHLWGISLGPVAAFSSYLTLFHRLDAQLTAGHRTLKRLFNPLLSPEI
ncbi:hypothetical protein BS47DRAFT_1488190 [Hydnum rufescens UP504]|uniref:Uncharacterized protein n=1 Tax=Hydnum rufescens UP504 TaxID=1448309 RepID=A0A9P6AQ54_9AGAM|nr:hypothetical protein BS47DRAFT_1488190 [Hydnum rufescens UP504]